ncbi:RbmA family biofilm matrix protein [Microbulbifer sp. VAAC004]|uniref:RbmA family biofilm matrix protein n=1 Tax=unclassified Microbulbifer TaxID=2619833 RepID=UPI00403988C5
MKKLTNRSPRHKAVVKNSIAGFSFICASTLVQADTISTTIDLGEPYPFSFEDRVEHEVDLDIAHQFDTIEKVCFKTKVKGGNADRMAVIVGPEYVKPCHMSYEILYPMSMVYTADDPTPENPNPVSELQDVSLCLDQNSLLAKNLLDGEVKFSIEAVDGYVEFWDVELVVEGESSDIQLAIEIDEPAEFSVPSYGGRVNYDASIRNLDYTQSLVTFEQWSVLKLPNGTNYPIHKSRDVVLNYSEAKDYTRNYLNIPAWFEAGDYELTWYVVNPSTGNLVEDSLYFTKSAD